MESEAASASLPPVAGDSEETGSPPPTQNICDENTNVNASPTDNEAKLMSLASLASVSMSSASLPSAASLASVSMPSASLPSAAGASLPPAAGDSEETGSPPPTQNDISDDENTNVNASPTDNEAELMPSASLASVFMPSAYLPSVAGDSEDRGSPLPSRNGVLDSDTVHTPSEDPMSSASLPLMAGDREDTGSPPAQNIFISDGENANGSDHHISGSPSPVGLELIGGEAVVISPTSSTTSSSEDNMNTDHEVGDPSVQKYTSASLYIELSILLLLLYCAIYNCCIMLL